MPIKKLDEFASPPPSEEMRDSEPIDEGKCGHQNMHTNLQMFCRLPGGHEGNHEASYKLNGKKAITSWRDEASTPPA